MISQKVGARIERLCRGETDDNRPARIEVQRRGLMRWNVRLPLNGSENGLGSVGK
jgi:hypothetical protein